MKNQVGAKEVETCIKGAGGATCDQHNSNKAGSMATAELQTAHSNARVNVCDFNLLHNYFLHMFETSEETNPVKEKTKKNKKSKKCSKSKDKRALEPLSGLNTSVPEIKINRNASWFAMFASVRRTCLEHQSRAATLLQVAAAAAWQDGCETDTDNSDTDTSKSSLPKVVGLGLRAVFDMIKETETSHPLICQRGLKSLLDVLQGLQPEDLKDEPEAVMETMFSSLLDLASRPGSPISINGNTEPGGHIRALACSCLLSLSVASGSTAHLLRTTAALLMSPRSHAGELVTMPGILASLQRSVHSLLIRRTVHPDFMSHGVTVSSLVDTFPVLWRDPTSPDCSLYSLASDGHYLYLHSTAGLHKVGSGFSGTMRGHVYRHHPTFYTDQPGWLGLASGTLYYKSSDLGRFELVVLDTETLEPIKTVTSSERFPGPHLMLSDGHQVGLVTAGKDDTFTIKFLSPSTSPMVVTGDLPIKLARKCVELLGSSVIDEGGGVSGERYHVEFGVDDEVSCVANGKEFALMLTNNGKLYYTGKSIAIGHKQHCCPGRWNEVIISKSGSSTVTISQFSVGHDGLHALLVAEDGSVYFTGTSKRGEDADHQSKPRRQPKPSKPKKMSRMEGHHVVSTACNSGTSCILTKKGELFVFGKDSSHADFSTGQVTELSSQVVTAVAAGKAHICVLTANSEVFTFGMNNKGQCGREFPAGPVRQEVQVEGEEVEEDQDAETEVEGGAGAELVCAPGKHKWKHDQCMVCTVCGECTGYGAGCVSASRPDRNPGMFCGCGSGDSGCATCGSCRVCCGEAGPELEAGGQDGLPVRDLIRLDLMAGQPQQEREPGARSLRDHRDKFIKRRLAKMGKESRRNRKYAEPMGGNRERSNAREAAGPQKEEQEKEPGKLTSLGPGRVHLPNNIKVCSVSCGLHHTLLLTTSGQVYAFGSNTHGQLGVGDLVPRGAPSQVINIKERVVRVAAGSYHSVALTAGGRIVTWGYNGKLQLGRLGPPPDANLPKVEIELWYAFPAAIPGLGQCHGKTVTWVGASADQTILKLDESLINAQNLVGATICANKHQVVLLPTHNRQPISFHSLCISRHDGFCRSFSGLDQVEWSGRVAALDPLFNVLWSICGETGTVQCHNPTTHDIELEGKQNIMTPDLALPVTPSCLVSRSQAALNLLSCLDTITSSPGNLTHCDEENTRLGTSKSYSKEDFSIVNRFDSHGGGWGYSGHSIEAVRFSTDTDILLGGFGLFGGRGEYVGKIKLFDIGTEGGENEGDGDLVCESDEVTYECGARQKYPVMFEEPVQVVAGKWYVAWARVSGPSSDCGSSGQGQVITEEQIMFTFKSSKKSNNGTDVNAGQIPQLLYRVLAPESSGSGRKYEPPEPVYILSQKFGRPLTTDSFQALLALLQWAWSTFKVSVAEVVDAPGNRAALMDLQRLVFICKACLRLIVSYIEDIYPSPSSNADKELSSSLKTVPETQRLAECVHEVRAQLVSMLSDPLPALTSIRKYGQPANLKHQALDMAESLLKDAHLTFVSCFHAFYPTGGLKWVCLCSLLSNTEERAGDRLLAAVIDSLCNPLIKLRSTFPIGVCDTQDSKSESKASSSPVENVSVTGSMAQLGEMSSPATKYPILAEVMSYHSQTDTIKFSLWTFSDVLNRLLDLVSQPIHEALQGEKMSYSSELVNKTCRLIACVVSELSSLKGGTEAGLANIATRVSIVTPSRFSRTSNSRTWNTGNGSPDAICFSVDRSGVMVAGASVYGGVGSFDYELELLHDQSAGEKDSTQSQRWVSLEKSEGTYSSDDCANDIAVLKFDKPVTVLPHTKYALRLRNHGARTNNGDGGQSTVKGSDGTTFTFTSCSLSFNGTNVTRGQIPQIIYYSSPPEEPTITNSTANLAQTFSRQSALSITVSVVRNVTVLLGKAKQVPDGRGEDILNSAPVITSLLPHIMASVASMASTDPVAAVKVLSLVQDLLPSVSELNTQSGKCGGPSGLTDSDLPSPHYAWVESDHPYKPAGLWNYRVVFPASVRWMSVEFDSACCTAQQEDSLQLYIRNPASQRPRNLASPLVTSQNSDVIKSQKYSPVLNKFSGKSAWPSHGVVLPGNEILFSLETASDYVKGESKDPSYGFKCLVTGYECQDAGEEGLKNLEHELAYLGGLCAASLMSKTIQLPSAGKDEKKEDSNVSENATQELFDKYPSLLKKGFAIEHLPNVQQALAGYIPFSCQSYERLFLKDYVQCSSGTAGGRLAAWLQPESYISTDNCGVIFRPEELRCSWPAIITVVTRDQYGATAHVPNMKVEVKAVPIDELNTSLASSAGQNKMRKLTQPDSMTFGGHPPPNLDTKYEVTVKDKMFYHAITVNKAYDNYSFEELRYASPKLQRQSENMLVRPNGDGTYSANWTPGNVGWYKLLVLMDGCELPSSHKVEVMDPPQGKLPPSQTKRSCPPGEVNRLRQFVAKPSAGLRIRLHPTLQSEQIGVVPVDGTLNIIDELSNSDGVWVRLSQESLSDHCPPVYTEGWCLQYNQHFDKVLLKPVAEPIPNKTKESSSFQKPPPPSQNISNLFPTDSKPKKKVPGLRKVPGSYTVVKCGASGHNIRCAPSLYAPPIGMLSLGDNIRVSDVRELGSGECWIKLEKENGEKFSFGPTDGEVWSLAVGSTGTHFIESDVEIQAEQRAEQRWSDSPLTNPASFAAPFDVAGNDQPVWSAGAAAASFFSSNSTSSEITLSSPRSLDSSFSRRKSLPRPVRPSTPPRSGLQMNPQALGAVNKIQNPNSPTFGRGRAGSVEKKTFFQKWFKGDDPGRRPSSSSSPLHSRKSSPADSQRKSLAYNKDIPPELQGVSVKELVKVIGASRANGNGVTPPGTPGTPRKSRSASPAPAALGAVSALAFTRSRSSSPISIGHGRGLSPKSQPSASISGETPGLTRQNSAQSDTSALVSSLTRDMSGLSASPASLSRLDTGSMSPVSLKSDQIRLDSPHSRQSSPRRSDSNQVFQMSTTSMEISRESLKDLPEPPMLTSEPPPVVAVKPKIPNRPPSVSQHKTHRSSSDLAPTGPVVEAMSPSVAESIRAVFAAFIWHAGVVQDAMACASFLKHNTGLTKRGSATSNSNTTSKNLANEKSSREMKARQRHSVEVISTAYLNHKEIEMEKSAVNANTNRNVTKHLSDVSGAGIEPIPEDMEAREEPVELNPVPGLPPTLGQLVLLWEGVVLSCLDTLMEQTSSNTWNKERNKGNQSNKSKNLGNNAQWKEKEPVWSTGNNKDQSEGSRAGGAGGIYQMCEICGGYFEHPVTYHMRMSHPGCGGHAEGKGYNSGGQYCGGWAGNCGDGGLGGSSWYLICKACKDKHSKGHSKSAKSKPSLPEVPLLPRKLSDQLTNKPQFSMPITSMMASFTKATANSPVGQMECHVIMKSNSVFLLDLASSTTEDPARKRTISSGPSLATVSELTPGDPGAFPYTQFHCLEALGIQDHQLRELNDELLLEENWRRGTWEGREDSSRSSSETVRQGESSDKDSDKPDANTESEIEPPSEFQGASCELGAVGGGGVVIRRNKFHRSVSIGSPRGKDWSPSPGSSRILTNRKRNSSHEESSDHHHISTAEFLAHTSPAWKKLFEGGNVTSKLLDSPVLGFLLQWNDLDSLQVAMQVSLRKAVCRSYAMQAFTWLLRSVSQPVCIHDLLWYLISSWQVQPTTRESNKNNKKDKDEANAAIKEEDDHLVSHKEREEGFEHPMSDLSVVGGAEQVLQSSFHSLLQTISDLMRLLPLGSALQQAAITCFSLKFWPSDHPFLHQSHLFSTISKILSRGEAEQEVQELGSPRHLVSLEGAPGGVESWGDLTSQVELTVSSRQAMIPSLNDGSTETFWESGDEDRNKTKWISLKVASNTQARSVAVHVDNGRDIGNKVGSLAFKTGKTLDDMSVLKTVEIENRFAGWVTCFLNEGNCDFVKIEVKGPDNTVRLRQVKVIGKQNEVLSPSPPEKAESQRIQQSNCETETLRVFRLITRQVFGKLLESETEVELPVIESWEGESGTDLKEHVVGILFSRSRLSHLQKQVCSHIVSAISKEAECFRDEWELSLCSDQRRRDPEDAVTLSDAYCYEMLSLVMALSGSNVGRSYLALQYGLIKDLLSLLHTGTARVQRAVIAVLRRVLPLVPPVRFANLLSVSSLPPKDFTILTAASLQSKSGDLGGPSFDPLAVCVLDIFLACISKALTIQVKKKTGSSKSMTTLSLATCIHPRDDLGPRWWLRGSLSKKIAEEIIQMLKDMMLGKFSEEWRYIAKSAIAEAILNLTKLGPELRSPEEGIKCGVVWLAVAGLTVLDKDHAEGLSSGEWGGAAGGQERPTCDNHDDGETLAIILCDTCGNLCADCDRFLHLHRKTRHHSRQVFKEEEEAIKVNLHEGCGRTKLFWLTAAADSATLKGMIEFREESSKRKASSGSSSTLVCRYCGASSCAALPVLDGVCSEAECQEFQLTACTELLACGHPCGGIAGETRCLPCLQGCDKTLRLKQDADDMCMICFTDPLHPIPSILLECGHVFHYHCVKAVLSARWHGPRISFGFIKCPICKVQISHPALQGLLEPVIALYEDVRKKALMRLEYEGLSKCEAVTSQGARWFNDPAGFAMDRYAYYVCFKCGKAYFGGEARCDLEAGAADTYNPEELVCGGCSDVSQAQMCPKHGTDYLEYKCRYCCSVAVFFCFGTTHFCNACHDDFQRVANIPKTELPQCPVAPKAVPLDLDECPLHVKHPATGEEFALGCGVCRNAHTF